MRKILLSGFVVLSFIIYSFNQRGQNSSPAALPVSTKSLNVSENQSNNIPTPTLQADNSSSTPLPTSIQSSNSSKYKDGQFTGDIADAFYGNVQVQVTISGGKITDVKFLDYPQDRGRSVEINSQATPMLQSEAIQAQSANVDIVSGATATSQAFIQSLQSALTKAQS